MIEISGIKAESLLSNNGCIIIFLLLLLPVVFPNIVRPVVIHRFPYLGIALTSHFVSLTWTRRRCLLHILLSISDAPATDGTTILFRLLCSSPSVVGMVFWQILVLVTLRCVHILSSLKTLKRLGNRLFIIRVIKDFEDFCFKGT